MASLKKAKLQFCVAQGFKKSFSNHICALKKKVEADVKQAQAQSLQAALKLNMSVSYECFEH